MFKFTGPGFLTLMVVALVVLALFLMFFPQTIEVFEGQRRQYFPPGVIVAMNEPDISIIPVYQKGNYFYTVHISNLKLKMSKDLEEDITVVPVLHFKGKYSKGETPEERQENEFQLLADEPELRKDLSFTNLFSTEPPVQRLESPVTDKEMDVSQKYIVGNYAVTLQGLRLRKDDLLSSSKCWADFMVECYNSVKLFSLKDWHNCEDDKDNCRKSLNICNGNIIVTLYGCTYCRYDWMGASPNCHSNPSQKEGIRTTSKGKDQTDPIRTGIYIAAEGGDEFVTGEELEISFWKKSLCVDERRDAFELLEWCKDDFLGAETFVYPVTDSYTPVDIQPDCSCSQWILESSCGSPCRDTEIERTRDCNPDACLPESDCLDYGACDPTVPSDCTYTSDCDTCEYCLMGYCIPLGCPVEEYCDGNKRCTKVPECEVTDVGGEEYHVCSDTSYQTGCFCSVGCGASPECDGTEPGTNGCDENCQSSEG
jgi:hypothetical protein